MNLRFEELTPEDIDLENTDVVIELTRWCNMSCPHCMRGDRSKFRIKKDTITKFLDNFTRIDTLVFTGGEPSLAIDLMEFTLQYCRYHGIEVGSFWMATNGTNPTKKFFEIFREWLDYCDDNEGSGLRVSIDEYHDGIDGIWKFREFTEETKWSYPAFCLEERGAPDNHSYLISAGRAVMNYPAGRSIEHSISLIDWEIKDEERFPGHIEAAIQLSAKGVILSTCDISFEEEDYPGSDYRIGTVDEPLKKSLVRFFQNFPDRIAEFPERETV